MSAVYAVRKGHTPGIFTDLAEYEQSMKKFKGAEGRRFNSVEAAQRYLDGLDQPTGPATASTATAKQQPKQRFYAVRCGHVPGIYEDYQAANAQLRGFAGAVCKRFNTREAAEAYLAQPIANPPQPVKAKKLPIAPPQGKGAKSTLQQVGAITPQPTRAVEIYTDGGCLVTKGDAGGYAAVICFPNGNRREISGGVAATNSGRMELLAAVEALKAVAAVAHGVRLVRVHTDSQYLTNGVRDRIWTRWATRNPQSRPPEANADLWWQIAQWCKVYKIDWLWVKGHAGNPYNERCDYLATEAARRTVVEQDYAPDRAAELQSANGRINVMKREIKRLSSDVSKFRLLAGKHVDVLDKHFYDAVYNESLAGFVTWKLKSLKNRLETNLYRYYYRVRHGLRL